ncbi:hypothetical protein [Streptomyces sp. NPDC001508]|uniref:hypothetical protein n=1 Tax=Streptomyces sp. NPDC001508 TaxID=3154656 RepID=UPI0033256C5B
MPVYWLSGVRHVGDVSPVCGFRMEQEKAGPDNARRVAEGVREFPKQQTLQGVEYRCGACWRTGS